MTVHRQRGRIAGGYGWYYLGFALAMFGVGALIFFLATGTGELELSPLRPLVYLLAIGVIAAVIKLRPNKRG